MVISFQSQQGCGCLLLPGNEIESELTKMHADEIFHQVAS